MKHETSKILFRLHHQIKQLILKYDKYHDSIRRSPIDVTTTEGNPQWRPHVAHSSRQALGGRSVSMHVTIIKTRFWCLKTRGDCYLIFSLLLLDDILFRCCYLCILYCLLSFPLLVFWFFVCCVYYHSSLVVFFYICHLTYFACVNYFILCFFHFH